MRRDDMSGAEMSQSSTTRSRPRVVDECSEPAVPGAAPSRPRTRKSQADTSVVAAQLAGRGERAGLPMRRSRRWIELRATVNNSDQELEGRQGRDHPRSSVAVPDVLLSPFSELSLLAARIAISVMVESVRHLRDLTAHAYSPNRRGSSSRGAG